MKPSDLFGVLVRLTGLLVILFGIYELWGGVDNIIENMIAAAQGDNDDIVSSFSFFAFGFPSLVVGALLFFFANFITRLAYRDGGA
ncbi:MAG TPA: hypothetical protein VFV81_09970 [Verrucomicrobiae bacterium]|nr:hypothetical protein [Verrucomicrobiae bacterium]